MDTSIAGFKKYIYKGRSGTPKVSIRKCGQIAFNAGAVQKYDLDVFKFVMVYVSDNKKRIAVRFTNNDKESGLIKVQSRPGSFAFSARNFLVLNDVNWSKTVNFDFTWEDKEKTAYFTHTHNDSEE